MGKKSRLKRERQAAPPAPAVVSRLMLARAPTVNDYTGAELSALMSDVLHGAEAEAVEQRRIDRINNMRMGDPDNAHKIAETFDPISAMLDEIIATGGVNVGSKGQPIMLDAQDNVWFPVVPGLISMCDTFALLAKQYGWTDQTDGMRKLAKKLDIDMPFFIEDIDAARVTIAWMREQAREITPSQFSAEAIDIQIREAYAERLAA